MALTIVDITAMANPVHVTYTLSSSIMTCMGDTLQTIVVGWAVTCDTEGMTCTDEDGIILS